MSLRTSWFKSKSLLSFSVSMNYWERRIEFFDCNCRSISLPFLQHQGNPSAGSWNLTLHFGPSSNLKQQSANISQWGRAVLLLLLSANTPPTQWHALLSQLGIKLGPHLFGAEKINPTTSPFSPLQLPTLSTTLSGESAALYLHAPLHPLLTSWCFLKVTDSYWWGETWQQPVSKSCRTSLWEHPPFRTSLKTNPGPFVHFPTPAAT